MIIYGLQDVAPVRSVQSLGYAAGPVPLLQLAQIPHLHDERSDRSRTVWPHVYDALHGPQRRWHMSSNGVGALESMLQRAQDELIGVELLTFLESSSAGAGTPAASTLGRIWGGARPEVTGALAVLFLRDNAASLADFQSRAMQREHALVRNAMADIGTIAMDRPSERGSTAGDAMHGSELPFLVSASVGETSVPDLAVEAGRDLDGSVVWDTVGWRLALWGDRLVMVSARANHPYWPRIRQPEVALAAVGDAVLMRIAQRYVLHMLATRVGVVEPKQTLALQQVAHELRARLWWEGLSGDPLVASAADGLARAWNLRDLATETFNGLEDVARRFALDAADRQAMAALENTKLTAANSAQTLELTRQTAHQSKLIAQNIEATKLLVEQTAAQTEETVKHTSQARDLTEETVKHTGQTRDLTAETRKLAAKSDVLNRIIGGFAIASVILAALTFALDPALDSITSKLRVAIAVAAAAIGIVVALAHRGAEE